MALLVNRGNQPLAEATWDVEKRLADVVPLGRWFQVNPDFVGRCRAGAALNAPDTTTFYSACAPGEFWDSRASGFLNGLLAVRAGAAARS